MGCWQSIELDFTPKPICHIFTGALSEFASVVFGSEVLAKEVVCQAQGHEHCFADGRSASEWGMSSSQVQELWAQMELKPFEKEMEILREKLKKTQTDLATHQEKIRHLEAKIHPGTEGSGIIYRSTRMKRLMLLADKVAPTRSTVLIQGESDTGKEMIARYIHGHSGRADHPFRAVNCAALPSTLLESELFGHVKGALPAQTQITKACFWKPARDHFSLMKSVNSPLNFNPSFYGFYRKKKSGPLAA